jgi:CPA1 family monovalent cation:H+ antiporter
MNLPGRFHGRNFGDGGVITSFAFPIVIITSCVVAIASKAFIPGFTWALGFLLGGIISPPDAISATTIMRQVKVSKSFISIVEGESLLNDASSLIVFRFALAAVITGQFHFGGAVMSFFLVVIMGILIGLAVGFIFFAIHRWLPTTTSIEIVLTLLTPYCMYYAAERFSGVLAVVSGGLPSRISVKSCCRTGVALKESMFGRTCIRAERVDLFLIGLNFL